MTARMNDGSSTACRWVITLASGKIFPTDSLLGFDDVVRSFAGQMSRSARPALHRSVRCPRRPRSFCDEIGIPTAKLFGSVAIPAYRKAAPKCLRNFLRGNLTPLESHAVRPHYGGTVMKPINLTQVFSAQSATAPGIPARENCSD